MHLATDGPGPQIRLHFILAWTLGLALLPTLAHAQYVLEDIHDPKRYGDGFFVVPIGYASSGTSAAFGAAIATVGGIQPQLNTYLYAIGSSNGSYGGVIGLSDLQLRPLDRFFLDMQITYFRTEHDENNVNGAPRYPFEDAGANNSSPRDFIGKASNDLIGNFTFKYVLPIGDGRDHIIDHYRLREGLLDWGADCGASGQDGWNPMAFGRSYFEITPRFEYMQLRSPHALQHQQDTNGIELDAVYDNRDYLLTPEHGNTTTVGLIRDFGLFGSSGPWTTLSAEYTQYISLGRSKIFRQQVLALDGWTCYCPTWSQTGTGSKTEVSGGPPFFDGAELGGQQHLRGFPEERFHDRAGIYGSAELRLIPVWNPLGEIPLLKPADVAWMQFVIFAETGRVADEYTFDKLFSHLKGDTGVGIRVMTQDTVLRIDAAFSSEGFQVWANIDQAF